MKVLLDEPGDARDINIRGQVVGGIYERTDGSCYRPSTPVLCVPVGSQAKATNGLRRADRNVHAVSLPLRLQTLLLNGVDR